MKRAFKNENVIEKVHKRTDQMEKRVCALYGKVNKVGLMVDNLLCELEIFLA